MGRLTKRVGSAIVSKATIKELAEKLAKLEDLEEQGKLLPILDIGTNVYGINCKGVAEYTVYAIIIDILGIFLKIKPKNDKKLPHAVVIDHSWNIGQIGEKLFLTKEEAERKLREVQNG